MARRRKSSRRDVPPRKRAAARQSSKKKAGLSSRSRVRASGRASTKDRAKAARVRIAKAGARARGKGLQRRPDGWGATTRLPRSWLIPSILYRRYMIPLAQADPREDVRAFAIVEVFKEGYGDKPDRVEIDLWSLGTNKPGYFLSMPPTEKEAARVGWDFPTVEQFVREGGRRYGGRLVRVLALIAEKPRPKGARLLKRTKVKDYWTVDAKRVKRRVKWEGEDGTMRLAATTARRVRKSRHAAKATPGGRSRR